MLNITSILQRLKLFISRPPAWKEIEYFNSDWTDRVELMASFIPKGTIVMDLGCGQMHLKKFLHENTYIPVDYCKRDIFTIVCDFNNYEFPAEKTDVVFISGCLEYIHDYNWLIKKSCLAAPLVIISYCTTDQFQDQILRHRNNWQNHLSAKRIRKIFYKNGFSSVNETMTISKNHIFIFKKL